MEQGPCRSTSLTAARLSDALHRRELSCRELMRATLARIDALNPKVNALVGLLPHDGLLAQADERDAMLAHGRSMGWMHGFPQAIKDLSPVAGLPRPWARRCWPDRSRRTIR